jgi:acetylornithine aminotransferase
MTEEAVMPTYKRLPVAMASGQGAWVWDAEGDAYLDALAGIAVCGLGHAHPGVAEAVAEQARTLVHSSNLYRIPPQEALGARLIGHTGDDRVFFCNSGAEANETAIKLARRYGHDRGIEHPRVVVCHQSFHGRTLATLSATGNSKIQAGFEPLLAGFVHVPFGDAEAIEAAADEHVVAVLVEPVQGEGGIRPAPAGYLDALRSLCDRKRWLLLCDEVQSGMARTGRFLGQHHSGARADVTTLAKSLGNGVPIGACLARGHAAEVLGPGSHGTTFGGNPLACRAALAVLDAIERDGLEARAADRGARLMQRLRERLDGLDGVREIRGKGLMIGIELTHDCGELMRRALDQGLLINVTAGNVVRLLPPLIISEAEADRIADGVAELVRAFLAEQ